MNSDSSNNSNSDMSAMFDASREAHQSEVIVVERGTGDSAPFLVTSDRAMVHDVKAMLDARRPMPERARGTAALFSLDSFIAHATRTSGSAGACAVFVDANPQTPRLTAVYNYHERGAGTLGARWCDHRAVYTFPLSRAWKAWAGMAGRWVTQEDFAAFIEDHAHELASPKLEGCADAVLRLERLGLVVAEPSEVLTASRGLSLTVDSHCESAVSLSTGDVKLVWEEKVRGEKGQALTIPGAFIVAIPTFEGDKEVHALSVRLRFRAKDGEVMWSLVPLGAEDVIRDAVLTARDRVASEVSGVEVFEGSPEA